MFVVCECDLVLLPKFTDDGFYFYLLDAILTSISISFFLFQSPVNRFRPGALPTRSHPETRCFSRTPHQFSEPCRAPATELQSSGRPRGARRSHFRRARPEADLLPAWGRSPQPAERRVSVVVRQHGPGCFPNRPWPASAFLGPGQSLRLYQVAAPLCYRPSAHLSISPSVRPSIFHAFVRLPVHLPALASTDSTSTYRAPPVCQAASRGVGEALMESLLPLHAPRDRFWVRSQPSLLTSQSRLDFLPLSEHFLLSLL